MTKLEQLIQDLCPNGVKMVKLGDVGEFYGGLSGKTKEDFKDGNAKFITYKNIYANMALELEVDDKVYVAEGEKQNTVQYGDVLFTGSSETPDECGMSSVLTTQTDEKLYLNSFCFGWRLYDKSLYLPDFLKHLFRCSAIRKEIGKTASGVTRFNVSKKKMAELQIPLPPLAVQSEIVRLLDKFTLYKSELAAELAARCKQYEHYRNQLLTFDENTKRVKLGEVAEISRGVRVVKKDLATDGHIPVFQNSMQPLGYYDKTNTKSNTTFVISAGAAGEIGFSKVDYWAADDCLRILGNSNVNDKFIYYWLLNNQKSISSKVRRASIPRLSKDVLVNHPIPLPPLEVQKQIVAILDRFDALCNDIKIGLPAEIELRQKQYEHYRDRLLTFEAKGD